MLALEQQIGLVEHLRQIMVGHLGLLVSGSWFLVPGLWLVVPGSGSTVAGSRLPVAGGGMAHAAAPVRGYTSWMRCRMLSTLSSGPTPKPEWSWLMPPMEWTGTRPRTASWTSSTI